MVYQQLILTPKSVVKSILYVATSILKRYSTHRKNTYICVHVLKCILGHEINNSLLPARVQRFESHTPRGFLPPWIPKAWHIIGTHRRFDQGQDGFKFSQLSSKQVSSSQLRKAFSKTQV